MQDIKQLLEELQNNLHYEIRQRGYNGEQLLYTYYAIPEINKKLAKTPFYYDSENDFFHFTSLESFYSILNTGHLRLYNLNNMDDKFEFDYARKILKFPKTEEPYKEQLFCLSMCSTKSILSNTTKEHLLWKLHGKDGNGVLVRFKFVNDLSIWKNYHLAKVHYDDSKLKRAIHLQPVQQIHTQSKNDILDARICCFLKHPIYEFEEEIRLVFENRESKRTTLTDKVGKLLYPIIYPDKLHKPHSIYYHPLPLWNFNKEVNEYTVPSMDLLHYEMPKIQILSVSLGYRYNKNELKALNSRVNIFDKGIEINFTKLKKNY